MSESTLLSGNEAVALGAHLAGVRLATGYPGTPSTEILEALARGNYEHTLVQWSTNEKVALEVGIGASLAGQRALVTMKHVGLNVAADPLMTLAYAGVQAGLVIVTADDPGMHSSQNEQDNRNYARFAKIPILEPSDSQEACDMVRVAFEISEEFDTPVLLRTTTRISHSKTVVTADESARAPQASEFLRDPKKTVMIPAYARGRRVAVEERTADLIALAEASVGDAPNLNRVEIRDTEVGIITGGVAYQYVREALPEASIFKLGISYPLPTDAIRAFARRVQKLYVVEELDTFWETELRAQGVVIEETNLPRIGELSPGIIRQGLGGHDGDSVPAAEVPIRPPVLCPGCPHRGVFYTLKRLGYLVTGDIGCYSLGVLPPLEAMDTLICMGASIGMALGVEKALGAEAPPTVAVIGDSTFLHSGMTGLSDVFFNGGHVTTIILDNYTTAMTGHQGNPTAGYDVYLAEAPRLDFEALVRGLGVRDVTRITPYDMDRLEEVLEKTGSTEEPSVIIVEGHCVLLPTADRGIPVRVSDECTGCGACLRLGCPAIRRSGPGKRAQVEIVRSMCTGCGLCVQVCPFSAMEFEGNDT